MQTYFNELADHMQSLTRGGEVTTAWLAAEQSDFIRFNKSALRQAMNIRQIAVTLGLIADGRRIELRSSLSGDAAPDKARLAAMLGRLRDELPQVPPDPYLQIASEVNATEHRVVSTLPDPGQVIERVLAAGKGRDLVGLYAAGPIMRGFANSLGQRNWHEVASFELGWSFYHRADKAVKSSYAGAVWDDAVFDAKVRLATEQLARLAEPAKSLQPGRYRAYFTPTAMNEFLGALAWGGFGTKSQRTRQSALMRLHDGAVTLSPAITCFENVADAMAPSFQADGFVKPARVMLIERGVAVDTLTSPRTAREYGIASNAANAEEMPDSLELAPGSLARDDALAALDSGLYIGNLWYLNYSDRQACRLTGMTRFASFWVENGRIVAPLQVMRFDDSIYRIFGPNLLALTREQELVPDGDTYEARSTRSVRTPGALVSDFALTL
ncbi:MAG: TldE/PmbA family protein [Sterolibacteriaceae bacterium]|nr:TldE/PmbA family protein [Sterolibacteriaceae bacterium]MBK9084741.1 TldE/PmbA family protein [Sterolibacteriaceae bacterium]